ncbi:MAG: hypothetical protein M5U34_42670 [Chloroflexi bacterium]|nr:hypothetical protein [Chloroflexota bacterium]
MRNAGELEDAEAEADVYLEHPFTPRKLFNRIKMLLPTDDVTEEVVRYGPITFFPNKPSVDVSGKGEQRLTPKLAQLLQEFLRHPNEVVTRVQADAERVEDGLCGRYAHIGRSYPLGERGN